MIVDSLWDETKNIKNTLRGLRGCFRFFQREQNFLTQMKHDRCFLIENEYALLKYK